MSAVIAAIIDPRKEEGGTYHGNPECNRIRRSSTAVVVVSIVEARGKGFTKCPSFTRERSTIAPCWTERGYVVPDEMARRNGGSPA